MADKLSLLDFDPHRVPILLIRKGCHHIFRETFGGTSLIGQCYKARDCIQLSNANMFTQKRAEWLAAS